MKVAVIVPSLTGKGPVLVARDILLGLKNRVSYAKVFYFDETEQQEHFPCDTERISFFQQFPFDDYDLVHSHGLRPDAYVWYHRKKIKCPAVTTKHNFTFQDYRQTYNWLTAAIFTPLTHFLMRRHDKIVMLTKDMLLKYSRVFPEKKLTYIYNGRNLPDKPWGEISRTDREQIEALRKTKIIIGACGMLIKRKGFHQVIDSLKNLSEFAFLLIGDGKEMDTLKKRAIESAVDDRCLFLGYRPAAFRYMQFMDIYVLSSSSEGFPLVLLEAGQIPLPVVCSDRAVPKEIYDDEQVCYYEYGNISSLAQAIMKAYKERSMFKESIRNKTMQNYSVEAMAKKYFLLYQALQLQCSDRRN